MWELATGPLSIVKSSGSNDIWRTTPYIIDRLQQRLTRNHQLWMFVSIRKRVYDTDSVERVLHANGEDAKSTRNVRIVATCNMDRRPLLWIRKR